MMNKTTLKSARKLLLAAVIEATSLFYLVTPSVAQIKKQDNSVNVFEECPFSVNHLMIGNTTANIEMRLNALLRLLDSPSECDHNLASRANQISRLLDEAYEEGLLEPEQSRESPPLSEEDLSDDFFDILADHLDVPAYSVNGITTFRAAESAETQLTREQLLICRFQVINRIWRRCS